MKQQRSPAAIPAIRLRPIGVIRSPLKSRKNAPRQGSEGAPDAWLEIRPWAMPALHRLAIGDEVFVIMVSPSPA